MSERNVAEAIGESMMHALEHIEFMAQIASVRQTGVCRVEVVTTADVARTELVKDLTEVRPAQARVMYNELTERLIEVTKEWVASYENQGS